MNPLQFQVPHQSEPQVEQEVVSTDVSAYDPDTVRAVDEVFENMEIEPRAGRYSFIKALQDDLDQFRSGATDADLPRNSMMRWAREGVRNVLSK